MEPAWSTELGSEFQDIQSYVERNPGSKEQSQSSEINSVAGTTEKGVLEKAIKELKIRLRL